MTSSVNIFTVPPQGDGRAHHWTCPKAAPLLRTGDCDCDAATERAQQAAGLRAVATLLDGRPLDGDAACVQFTLQAAHAFRQATDLLEAALAQAPAGMRDLERLALLELAYKARDAADALTDMQVTG